MRISNLTSNNDSWYKRRVITATNCDKFLLLYYREGFDYALNFAIKTKKETEARKPRAVSELMTLGHSGEAWVKSHYDEIPPLFFVRDDSDISSSAPHRCEDAQIHTDQFTTGELDWCFGASPDIVFYATEEQREIVAVGEIKSMFRKLDRLSLTPKDKFQVNWQMAIAQVDACAYIRQAFVRVPGGMQPIGDAAADIIKADPELQSDMLNAINGFIKEYNKRYPEFALPFEPLKPTANQYLIYNKGENKMENKQLIPTAKPSEEDIKIALTDIKSAITRKIYSDPLATMKIYIETDERKAPEGYTGIAHEQATATIGILKKLKREALVDLVEVIDQLDEHGRLVRRLKKQFTEARDEATRDVDETIASIERQDDEINAEILRRQREEALKLKREAEEREAKARAEAAEAERLKLKAEQLKDKGLGSDELVNQHAIDERVKKQEAESYKEFADEVASAPGKIKDTSTNMSSSVSYEPMWTMVDEGKAREVAPQWFPSHKPYINNDIRQLFKDNPEAFHKGARWRGLQLGVEAKTRRRLK